MIIKTIDFNTIQSRIDAARHLQEANENSEAEKIMLKLATDIMENLK